MSLLGRCQVVVLGRLAVCGGVVAMAGCEEQTASAPSSRRTDVTYTVPLRTGTHASEIGIAPSENAIAVPISATIGGDIGSIASDALDADELTISDSGTSIRVDSMASGEWLMARLILSAELTSGRFAAGTRVAFDATSNPDDAPVVTLQGCAGPAVGSYDFDGHADQVDIQISEGTQPGERVLSFVATFDTQNAPRTLEGEVRYLVTTP